MKIKFLGAAGQVTGSSFLLTSSKGQKILIDLGMFQGSKETEQLNFTQLDFEPTELSAVLLTHAHLDHCGRLPLLAKNGFIGSIWMTPPTKDITEISLYDTAHINEEDDPDKVLYNEGDVDKTVALFKTIDYKKDLEIGDFNIVFRDAGHIIGSASIELIDNSSSDRKKIVFSGDLGNTPEDLIKPTEYIESANFAVIESTYGDRTHPNENINEIFISEINEIEQKQGTLLIPSFSIERSQEIVHRLSHLKAKEVINEDTMIFFDSPMGERVTEVFEKYTEYFNKELSADIKSYDPFHFPGITYTRSLSESRAIRSYEGSKIIIAGSGMLSGGRILRHAANMLPDPNTTLLFVGYQAEDTIGRKILDGDRSIYIDGVRVEINAKVSQIHSLSSHADQPRLLKWLKSLKGLRAIYPVHGDFEVRRIFMEKIKAEIGVNEVFCPNLNDEIEAI